MDRRQRIRRWSLGGSLAALLAFVADILAGKFSALQGVVSGSFLPRTAQVLMLFLAVILLLVTAELSKNNSSRSRDHE